MLYPYAEADIVLHMIVSSEEYSGFVQYDVIDKKAMCKLFPWVKLYISERTVKWMPNSYVKKVRLITIIPLQIIIGSDRTYGYHAILQSAESKYISVYCGSSKELTADTQIKHDKRLRWSICSVTTLAQALMIRSCQMWKANKSLVRMIQNINSL